jgi:hypothetical protein
MVVSVPNKHLARIYPDSHVKGGGTPDRLEETKRLRAKIREEQLIRLKKQKDTGSTQMLERQKEVLQHDQQSGKMKYAFMAQDDQGKATKANAPETSNLKVIPSLRKKSNSTLNSNVKQNVANVAHVREAMKHPTFLNHPTALRKSPPFPLTSRTSDLALIASRLRIENEKMSIKINNSRGLSSRPSSLVSSHVYGIDNFISGNITDSFKASSDSMFKEFVPVKQCYP